MKRYQFTFALGLAATTAITVMTGPTARAAPSVPGGGFQGCTDGLFASCGTIGLPWADSGNNPIGHLTVAHLAERESQRITATPFNGVPGTTMTVTQATGAADLGVTSLVSTDVAPTLTLSDGTLLGITAYVAVGSLAAGQPVCHSGWNDQTATVHEICGTIADVGPTDNCRAVGTGSSSCAFTFRANNGGRVGGPGDSGAAAYRYNTDGSVTVLGLFKGIENGDTGVVEPVYAASQIFGGRPFTGNGTVVSPPTTPTTPRPSTGSAGF
ncbi:hypothetical protein ACWEVD_28545 [Nocardia thailandica]